MEKQCAPLTFMRSMVQEPCAMLQELQAEID